MDQVKFFKGCLPQIFLGPFLNTLTCFLLCGNNIFIHFEKNNSLISDICHLKSVLQIVKIVLYLVWMNHWLTNIWKILNITITRQINTILVRLTFANAIKFWFHK